MRRVLLLLVLLGGPATFVGCGGEEKPKAPAPDAPKPPGVPPGGP